MRTEYLYFVVFILMTTAIFLFWEIGASVREAVVNTQHRKKKAKSFKKPSAIRKSMVKAWNKRQKLLAQSDLPTGVYWLFTVAAAIGGFFAGKMIYASTLIAIAVSVVGMIIPLIILGFRQTNAGIVRAERLCSSMMVLSNSYLSTNDFIKSVEENIGNLDYPEPFQRFLTQVTLLDNNVKHCLRRMEDSVNNAYFSQWVDALILAQGDRALKYVCVSVVDSMHDVISAQQESEAAMYAVWRDYIVTLILIFSVPLVFKFLMTDAYITMTTSPVGQGLFLLLLATVVMSVILALKINKPILE